MAEVRNVPGGRSEGKAGSATGPGAGAAIVTLAADDLPAGVYRLRVKTGFGGVAGAINDFELTKGAGVIATPMLARALANTVEDHVIDAIEFDGKTNCKVIAIAGHGTGVYLAEIVWTRLD